MKSFLCRSLKVRLYPVIGVFLLLFSCQTLATEQLTIGVLKFGTVRWELDVIQYHGLAKKRGLELNVLALASSNAINVSLQGGTSDIIVNDWIWVSRQRDEGKSYTFVPYSVAAGGLMARADSGINSVSDLVGRNLGVAGGPVDKSWLLLRAHMKKNHNLDPQEVSEVNFGTPPLLNELALRGDLDAILNFWHWGARFKAAGHKQVISIPEVLGGLGIDQTLALIGWTFDENIASERPGVMEAFAAASYEAKKILLESDEEWERLRPLTKAKDDATLIELRDAFRAGIPRNFGESEKNTAAEIFALLAQEGGTKLVGNSTQLNPGTFWKGFTVHESLFE